MTQQRAVAVIHAFGPEGVERIEKFVANQRDLVLTGWTPRTHDGHQCALVYREYTYDFGKPSDAFDFIGPMNDAVIRCRVGIIPLWYSSR